MGIWRVFFSLLLAASLLASIGGCGLDAENESSKNAPQIDEPNGLVWEPALLELAARGDDDHRRDVACRLVNRSGVEIRIISVRTNCACTMAGPLEHTILRPGDAVPLQFAVSFPSHGRKDSVVNVVVEPADIAAPPLHIVLEGPERPVPYLEFVPKQLRLAGRRPGETVTQACEISAVEQSGSEPWLNGAFDPAGVVEVEFDGLPTEEPRGDRVLRTYRFRVQGKLPQQSDAPERFSLRLKGTSAVTRNDAPFHIPGVRLLLPLARIVPAQIALRRSELAEWPVVRRVMIVTDDEGDFSVETPTNLPPWLTINQVTGGGAPRARMFEVQVTEPPMERIEISETFQFDIRSNDDRGTVGLGMSIAQ